MASSRRVVAPTSNTAPAPVFSPSTIRTTRFHPYLPVSIEGLISESYFDDRLEAFDEMNHLSTSFMGMVRRYHAKRNLLHRTRSEMTELEEEMVSLSSLINDRARIVMDNVDNAFVIPSSSSIEEEDDDDSLPSTILNEDPPIQDEEVTIVEASVPSSPPPLASKFFFSERVESNNGLISLVPCKVSRVKIIGLRSFDRGVRKRVYQREVPCSLCDDFSNEHYKCSNFNCTGRTCYLCFRDIQGTPLLCPYCREPFEIRESLSL